ncbi:hypothetical protein GLOIN_2v1485282 [Rhizophagus irregularis DAOM 181602=DAOM 197198]|uniref:Uncharacterized protein n=1 Tax=Rhizophagus irregularis (strain DAOM 181602 / DAOM 197198 / MUCL 43194) TaxID=747089 RepID=A0A2P4PB28_RHIID|nr:hypothetical protein GLOIN_2v1485282 [Rhizophagus irregularis DAOM 181602=DAOM 197198]POG62593.1 hypothetical protein GLOIN_2v1485282 [Rhizophagus irregularis DAOM 181602=DAOM 197198]|eukprot:XP_025169459.1 hypothetical protein GLOIN_2v1485282 [Rhizophagus irregularis DAOM 181602=DAOM 197198]
MAIMAQLLANELLIMTFKELLNETSFEYMSSIYTVCKKWKNLIELVLIEEIEFRLKNKLLIEKYEIKSEIEWNHKDCMCIYTKEFITIEKLIISLKKMCIILDILDEKLNTDKYQYKCITKKRMFSATLFDIDYIDFGEVYVGNITSPVTQIFYPTCPKNIHHTHLTGHVGRTVGVTTATENKNR